MKKHELLKYVYDNYPKGTKFKTFSSINETVLSSGEFKIYQNNLQGIWITGVETSWVIFCPNVKKWAEIVKDEPKEIEVKLYGGHNIAKIGENGILIVNSPNSVFIAHSDIEDISRALKQLNS